MNARALINVAAERITDIFNEHGVIAPMYHYVRDDDVSCIFIVPPFCETKDDMVAFARIVFKHEHAVSYVFINEAWMVRGADAETAHQDYSSLEHAPGRKEIVLLSAEDANGMLQGYMEIVRPVNDQPYLGALEINDCQGSFEGRMVGLLPRPARNDA